MSAGPQPSSPHRRRPWRGLRFRLMLSYALFFGLLLAGLGVVFRQSLTALLEVRIHEVVGEEWVALRAYLHFKEGRPVWEFDEDDPEESFFVERLRRTLLIATLEGEILEVTNGYRLLGVEPPEALRRMAAGPLPYWTTRTDSRGEEVFLRYGLITEEGKRYLIGFGRRSVEGQQLPAIFTKNYFAFLPLLLGIACLLGWIAAGRALRPVVELAETAERISSSTLDMRIPLRGTGDELDHLILTFNGMMERLKAGFEQIRQFSTDVSHELRTPLTAIRGQLEVALFTAQTPEQFREAMENALQDVERLSQLVRSLLLLSQAESGQFPLQKTTVDLSAIVAGVLDQYRILADEAGVQIDKQLAEESLVQGDRVQLERLVYNLLSNSLKFTPAGGRITVSLAPAQGGRSVELMVEDTGAGIAESELPHIFERFYKGSRMLDGQHGLGLGLGLSFVAWIVKVHDGRIEAASSPGKGSRFRVLLPVLQPPRLAAKAASRAHTGT